MLMARFEEMSADQRISDQIADSYILNRVANLSTGGNPRIHCRLGDLRHIQEVLVSKPAPTLDDRSAFH